MLCVVCKKCQWTVSSGENEEQVSDEMPDCKQAFDVDTDDIFVNAQMNLNY